MAPIATASGSAPSTKRVAVIQSAYIPWKGFFDLVARCDEYVIFDGVQFAKRHWHNRNRIKTSQGLRWLTIPVLTKARFEQPIEEVMVAEPWAEKHWRSIESNYGRAPCFEQQAPYLRSLYEQADAQTHLTGVNEVLLSGLFCLLAIPTRLVRDRVYEPQGTASDRLLDICRKARATHYLTGPSAKAYLEEEKFRAAGIAVEWMNYSGYPSYPQLWGEFEHEVSILDLIFNVGAKAKHCWWTGTS